MLQTWLSAIKPRLFSTIPDHPGIAVSYQISMSALYPWNHVEAKSTTSRSKAHEAPLHRDGVRAYLPLRCSETSSPRAPGPWSRHRSAWRTRHSPDSSWTLGPLEPCISPFPPKAKKDIEAHHWIAAAYLFSKYSWCLSPTQVVDL